MDIQKVFSKNLKYFRNKKGYSQEELAFISGLHRTYISALECEKRNISINNISKIAIALDIAPYLLLKENEEE